MSFSSLRMSQLSSSSSQLGRSIRDEYSACEFEKKIQAKTDQATVLQSKLDKSFNSAIRKSGNMDPMVSGRSLFTSSKKQQTERERDPSVIHFSPTKYNMNITYEPTDTPSQRFTKKWEGFNYQGPQNPDNK